MVQAPDKIALSGFARDGRVQRGIQDHLGLLKRRQLRKVAQEVKEPAIPWQVDFGCCASKPGKLVLELCLAHLPNRGDARWKLSDNGAIKNLVQIGVK